MDQPRKEYIKPDLSVRDLEPASFAGMYKIGLPEQPSVGNQGIYSVKK